jgi:ABC-type transporter Mla MlaB component
MTATNSGRTSIPSDADAANIVLEGRITAYTAGPVWQAPLDTLERNPNRPVVVEASRLEQIDDVGIALLFDLVRRQRPPAAQVELRDLEPRFAALVAAYDPKDFTQQPKVRERIGIFEHMGRATAEQLADAREMLEFLRAHGAALEDGPVQTPH